MNLFCCLLQAWSSRVPSGLRHGCGIPCFKVFFSHSWVLSFTPTCGATTTELWSPQLPWWCCLNLWWLFANCSILLQWLATLPLAALKHFINLNAYSHLSMKISKYQMKGLSPLGCMMLTCTMPQKQTFHSRFPFSVTWILCKYTWNFFSWTPTFV